MANYRYWAPIFAKIRFWASIKINSPRTGASPGVLRPGNAFKRDFAELEWYMKQIYENVKKNILF